MTVLAEPPTAMGLLAGFEPGRRADLAAHLAVHGRLPLPLREDDGWAAQAVRAVDDSGLTGRGGAAFPTGAKLRWLGEQRRRPVVAVNAMEGEPASRKDAVLATHVPHLVLDGAAFAARCIGAVRVFVCVPQGAEAAAASFERACAERAREGLDPVPVEVLRPPGGYVAGEESALSSWLDGRGALPRFRPDRPALLRVRGRPCLVDNAETLAHLSLVARHGAAAFRSAGTADAPGTTLVTVSGAVSRPGVYEIAMGTPVSSVLAMAGAGDRPAGVLLGGYGGTWLSARDLDLGFDPVSLRTVGATTGAGVVVALPSAACGLMETARVSAWMANESAGQCGPCVFGLPALADDLFQLASGRGRGRTVERLRGRLDLVEGRGACRHPDGVVRLVRTALRAFSEDLDRHLAHGPCPGAGQATVLPLPAPPAVG